MVLDRCFEYRRGPAEQPFGFISAHVDAPMAHLQAKVIVPIGPVEGIARWDQEELGPGYTWQVAAITGKVSIAHVFGWHFRLDVETPTWGVPRDPIWVGSLV